MAAHLRPKAAHLRPKTARGRAKAGIVLVTIVLAGVGVGAAAGASFSTPPPTPVERQIQDEIDGLRAGGVPEDSPKVAMLREQLARLRTGDTARPPRERGVDTGAVLAGRTDDATPAWQSGKVECEVVPNLLSAAEVAGATCASVPQPDGTSRYVAVDRDGVIRVVRFGRQGDVRRLPDTRAAAPAPPGTRVAATAGGDLELVPPGRRPAVVDLR